MWYVYRRTHNDGQHHAQELVVEVPTIIVGIHIRLSPGTYFLATERGYSANFQVTAHVTVFVEQPHDPMPFIF